MPEKELQSCQTLFSSRNVYEREGGVHFDQIFFEVAQCRKQPVGLFNNYLENPHQLHSTKT